MILCGKKNVPSRGTCESDDVNSDVDNDGNFRGLVRHLINNGDKNLKIHLDNAGHNTTSFSSQIRNEIICVVLEHIQEKFLMI